MYAIIYIAVKEVLMSTHSILAEKTVSITELRKNPAQFFQNEPVAVLSNNKTAGYMVSAEVYEQMMQIMEHASTNATAKFRPSKKRLAAIARHGAKLLEEASEKDLGDFTE